MVTGKIDENRRSDDDTDPRSNNDSPPPTSTSVRASTAHRRPLQPSRRSRAEEVGLVTGKIDENRGVAGMGVAERARSGHD